MRSLFISLCLLLLNSAFAAATLDGVNLGSSVCGPSISADDLKGKVVMFEYWGVNCPPCVASISHLTHLQEEYGRDNFLVVANHCQGGSVANTTKVWKSKATNDLVSVIDNGSLPGSNVSGIPRCFLFNHEGKLVYDGHPMDVDAPLKAAMEASPGALVSGMDYTVFAKEARFIGSQSASIGKLIGKLAEVKADDDGYAEAAYLLKNVNAYIEKQQAAAQADLSSDPINAMITLSKMASWLKGDDRADWFADQAKDLKKDPAFKDALKAEQMLTAAKSQADKIGLAENPAQIKSVKSKAGQVQAVASMLQTIEKKYPDSKAAKEAGALREAWGLY